MTNGVPQKGTNAQAGRFTESIIRVLRPLIRLMVGNITFNVFLDLAKQIYVEESQRELKRRDPKGRVTKSALALLTGIDTRAINQILAEMAEDKELDEIFLIPEAEVLTEWALRPKYRGPDDTPIDLPIIGRGLTFQNLVTKLAGRNVTAQTVLDRLTTSGNVELIDENTVRLISRIYFPLKGDNYEALDVGMAATANLLKTIHHNVSNQEGVKGRLVQQQRWSTEIPIANYEKFKAAITDLLREQVDESLSVIETFEEEETSSPSVTAGVGVYYFESFDDSS